MNRTVVTASIALLLAAAAPACNMKVRSLKSALDRELPGDCTSYLGTAAAGATCSSEDSAARARLVFTAHCGDLRDIGLTSVRVENSGPNRSVWRIESPGSSCEFQQSSF